jgi:hypothetical protein
VRAAGESPPPFLWRIEVEPGATKGCRRDSTPSCARRPLKPRRQIDYGVGAPARRSALLRRGPAERQNRPACHLSRLSSAWAASAALNFFHSAAVPHTVRIELVFGLSICRQIWPEFSASSSGRLFKSTTLKESGAPSAEATAPAGPDVATALAAGPEPEAAVALSGAASAG